MTLREWSRVFFLNRDLDRVRKRIDAAEEKYAREKETVQEMRLDAFSIKSPQIRERVQTSSPDGSYIERAQALLGLHEREAEYQAAHLQHLRARETDVLLRLVEARIALMDAVERIGSIEMRFYFRARFLGCLSWEDVAAEISEKQLDSESIKKRVYRFLRTGEEQAAAGD